MTYSTAKRIKEGEAEEAIARQSAACAADEPRITYTNFLVQAEAAAGMELPPLPEGAVVL